MAASSKCLTGVSTYVINMMTHSSFHLKTTSQQCWHYYSKHYYQRNAEVSEIPEKLFHSMAPGISFRDLARFFLSGLAIARKCLKVPIRENLLVTRMY